MKTRNICKFIPETAADTLEMQNFVYEMDTAVMAKPTVLKSDRAILLTQGAGVFRFDDTAVRCGVGMLVFGFCGETMVCEPEEGTEYIYISFGGARARTLFHRFGIYPVNRTFGGFEGMIPIWRESILRASESSIDLASESALLYAFSRFSSDEGEKGDAVNRAVVYINECFTEPTLSLTEVAQELGYHPKYLSHLFKERTGMNFSEYLRTVRIKHAVMLFSHGLDSVKSVALLSGFSDPLYFSSVFKSAVGISPREYKEQVQKGSAEGR